MATMGGLLIYDGTCGFCRRCVSWLERHRRSESALRVASSHVLSDAELAELTLTRVDVERFVWMVGPTGSNRGSKAIGSALGELNGVWPLLGAVISVAPLSWVASIAYRTIAKQRHRLPGATHECKAEPRPA